MPPLAGGIVALATIAPRLGPIEHRLDPGPDPMRHVGLGAPDRLDHGKHVHGLDRGDGQNYDVVLCDLRLPGLDGPALYDWMAERRPHLCARTAFITGDTLSASAGRFLARAGRPILEKPFVPAELQRLVAELDPQANSRPPRRVP